MVFCLILAGAGKIIGNTEPINLIEGKNNLSLNLSSPIYVKDFVKLNPNIEVISYVEDNLTIGYVNYLGGFGKNFIVQAGDYEIIAKKDTALVLLEEK
jgi:hypothetical protein